MPAAPSGATVTWDNAVTVGTVVTYTCSGTNYTWWLFTKIMINDQVISKGGKQMKDRLIVVIAFSNILKKHSLNIRL